MGISLNCIFFYLADCVIFGVCNVSLLFSNQTHKKSTIFFPIRKTLLNLDTTYSLLRHHNSKHHGILWNFLMILRLNCQFGYKVQSRWRPIWVGLLRSQNEYHVVVMDYGQDYLKKCNTFCFLCSYLDRRQKVDA